MSLLVSELMRRRRLVPYLASAAVPAALLAFAAEAAAIDPPECPPGEWFCEDAEEPAPVPGAARDLSESGPSESEPSESEPEPGSEWAPEDPGEMQAPPRRWTSEDEPPEIDLRRGSGSGGSEAGGRDARRRLEASPWSINLRVQGVMLGQARRQSYDARMGGVGASLRYEVNPVLTLDLGLDSMLGRDYNGYDRSEGSLSLSSLLYLNQHRLVRTYAIVGLNSSIARVDLDGGDQSWSYFGAHAGLGLDIALARSVSLDLDLLGFMRGRTDGRAAREPEFTDGSGRVSNTSGGGLLRAGVTLNF